MAAPYVELLYLDGCPNWEITAVRLSVALQKAGLVDVHVDLRRIDSFDEAERLGFTGSPMIRINGVDPFAGPGAPTAFECRTFRHGDGVVNGPTIAQLVEALATTTG